MVINTALCFVLGGFALLASFLSPAWRKGVQSSLGGLITLIAAIVLIQILLDWSAPWDLAGVHRPLQADYAHPGQMAPNTALGFLLFGFGLMLHNSTRARARLCLRSMTYGVIAIGVIGVFGYFLKLEVLYNWTGVVRMALHTGGGMILLGLGLWQFWRTPGAQRAENDQEEVLRIHRFSTALLILTASIAGVAGIALIQDRIETVMAENLTRMVQDRRVLFEQIISHRSERAAVMAEGPYLVGLIRQLNTHPTAAAETALQAHAQRMRSHGFSTIVYQGLHRQWAKLGVLHDQADIAVTVQGPYDAQLLWQDGYMLRTRIPLRDSLGIAGYVVAEQPLLILTRLSSEIAGWGATGDMAICGPEGHDLRCFPIRVKPEVFLLRDPYPVQPLPMSYAIRSQNGVAKTLDFRGKRVMAAYGPIGNTQLGMVMKMDVAEIYAPIREQFQIAFPFLALLVIFSTWFMRAQLRPLLHALVDSRRAARNNEARFVAAAEGSLDAFFILESVRDAAGVAHDFRFLFLNVPARVMLELGETPVLKRLLSEVLPAYRTNGCYEKYMKVLQSGESFTEESMSPSQTGVVWRRQQIVKLGDGVAVTLQDISERKRVEHLQHEFISTVSHELRTPLTAIRGALGLIMGGVLGELPPKAKDIARIADQNSQRLAALINDLLDMEKLIAQGLQFDLQVHRLQPLIEQSMEANRAYAEQHQVSLVLTTRAEQVWVYVDAQRLLQVVANLLSNAAKFSPRGGKVEIDIYHRAHEVQVSVTDRGEGIPQDFQQRVFQKFSQADASDTRRKGGTGLGLAISKELIEQMGGSIGFQSRPGRGTCFYFTLPLAADDKLRSRLPEAHPA